MRYRLGEMLPGHYQSLRVAIRDYLKSGYVLILVREEGQKLVLVVNLCNKTFFQLFKERQTARPVFQGAWGVEVIEKRLKGILRKVIRLPIFGQHGFELGLPFTAPEFLPALQTGLPAAFGGPQGRDA